MQKSFAVVSNIVDPVVQNLQQNNTASLEQNEDYNDIDDSESDVCNQNGS